MKEYLIKSIVSALIFMGLTLAFDAIFNEVGSIWKYVISGTFFGFAFEGWFHFFKKRKDSGK
jgi:hypothetical protein